MDLKIHGKQIDVPQTLRNRAESRINEINKKYFNHTTDAHVTFSSEAHGSITKVHILIHVGKNITAVAEAELDDPVAALDAAIDKVARRLRRYKKRLRDHHGRMTQVPEEEILAARYTTFAPPVDEGAGNDNTEEIDEAEEGTAAAVIAETDTDIQTMSVRDAVMRLDLSGGTAFMFRNGAHGGLNMVYRRADGNIGWVDPVADTA